MSEKKTFVHPYMPNTAPDVRAEMMEYLKIDSTDVFYEPISEDQRLHRPLNLPEPIVDEQALKKYFADKLKKNKSCQDYTSFLGGPLAYHYVPAVVDEMIGRGEFLTTFCSSEYSDHGKFQAWWEFQSLMGDLLDMDVVGMPTYCGGTASYSSMLLPVRVLNRREVLISENIDPERLMLIQGTVRAQADLVMVKMDPKTGNMDLEDLKAKISDKTACVYFENPGFLGNIETQGQAIADIAHANGAVLSVAVNPISLGLLEVPKAYGADIVCGDLQPLGVHMQFGGGASGFMAIPNKPEYKHEYSFLLIAMAETDIEGQKGFAYANWERTSWTLREQTHDFYGSATALYTIPAGVYLASMGPQGMREVGETIIGKANYAKNELAKIPGVKIVFESTPFQDIVVNFDGTGKTVKEINKALLGYEIFGGKDISESFPQFGQSALYGVTETVSKEEIDALVCALKEVTK